MRVPLSGLVLIGTSAVVAISVPTLAHGAHVGPMADASISAAVPAASSGQTFYAFNTALALSAGGARQPGVAVRIMPATGSAGQAWVQEGDGTIRPAYDERLCLNVRQARYKPGTQLTVWRCDGSARERFVTSAPSAHTPIFFISPAADSKLCLDASGLNAGGPVALGTCRSIDAEAWSTTDLQQVVNTIASPDSRVLEAASSLHPGSGVTDGPFQHRLSQYWEDAPYGSEILRPVSDDALCLSFSAEAPGTPLRINPCDQQENTTFLGIAAIRKSSGFSYYITTSDARYCLVTVGGRARVRAVVLAQCKGDVFWQTLDTLHDPLTYEQLESNIQDYVIDTVTEGGSGTKLVVSNYTPDAGAIWTELPIDPQAPSPFGSFTIRPLYDLNLCLTVPSADYASGVQLQVRTCDSGADQQFLGAPLQEFAVEIFPLATGRFCIGGAGGLSPGHFIALEPCDFKEDQAWSRTGNSGLTGTQDEISGYPLNNQAQGLRLSLSDVSAAGAAVDLVTLQNGQTEQLWLSTSSADGSTAFIPSYNISWCLDAPSYVAGTQLRAATCDGSASQGFVAIAGPGSGYVQIQSTGDSAMCLAAGAAAVGRTPVVLQACDRSQHSEWWNPYVVPYVG